MLPELDAAGRSIDRMANPNLITTPPSPPTTGIGGAASPFWMAWLYLTGHTTLFWWLLPFLVYPLVLPTPAWPAFVRFILSQGGYWQVNHYITGWTGGIAIERAGTGWVAGALTTHTASLPSILPHEPFTGRDVHVRGGQLCRPRGQRPRHALRPPPR